MISVVVHESAKCKYRNDVNEVGKILRGKNAKKDVGAVSSLDPIQTPLYVTTISVP